MLLYREINSNNIEFGAISLRDLRKGSDIIIIAGTSLKIPEIRKLAREFCRAAKIRKGGVTIWINKELLNLNKDFKDLLNYIIWGDYNAATSIFSVNLGY
jgi:NAD-dependent histone deacetylase SIR2